jgi:hypothetical protein
MPDPEDNSPPSAISWRCNRSDHLIGGVDDVAACADVIKGGHMDACRALCPERVGLEVVREEGWVSLMRRCCENLADMLTDLVPGPEVPDRPHVPWLATQKHLIRCDT